MTITTTDTVERYVGDGSQSAWPIRFPFFKGEDVKACIVNSAGEQVNLVCGIDYTVTKSTSSIGGTLHYVLADDVPLTIWLSLPFTQGTDFYNTGPLNAEVLEHAFDRLTLLAQQLQEASGRSIKVENSSTATPEQLLASLYAGRDAAVASASAAATSESNAEASEQAATTSKNNAATSKSAAAASALTAEAWAESDTPPDPNNSESKSAKSWALIAGDNVPIATATLAGKVKASASLQVDPATGEATVPSATDSLAGIARQATDAEVEAGTEDGAVFMTPYDVQQKIDTLATSVDEDISDKADADLSNVSDTGVSTAIEWYMPDYNAGVTLSNIPLSTASYTAPEDGWYICCFVPALVDTKSYLYINGVKSAFCQSYAATYGKNRASVTVPLSSGDVIYWSEGSKELLSNVFYPCKG